MLAYTLIVLGWVVVVIPALIMGVGYVSARLVCGPTLNWSDPFSCSPAARLVFLASFIAVAVPLAKWANSVIYRRLAADPGNADHDDA